MSLSFLSPLFLFCSFKLRTLIIVKDEHQYRADQYFNARFLSNTLLLVLSPLLAAIFFGGGIGIGIVLLVALYKWGDGWCELSYAYLQSVGRFSEVAKSQVFRALITITWFIISAWFDVNLFVLLAGWSGVTLGVAIIGVRKVALLEQEKHWLGWVLDLVTGTHLYRRSLALYKRYFTVSIALMMLSLYVYLPNFFLEAHYGVELAGYFATLSYFLVAGALLVNSLSQVVSPMLVELARLEAFNLFIRRVLQLCLLGCVIGVTGVLVGVFGGEWILRVIYNQGAAEYADELVWVLAAAGVRYVYIFVGTGMNALRDFHSQTIIYTLGTTATMIACYLLIPASGIMGAAWAMLIGVSVELLGFFSRFGWLVWQLKLDARRDAVNV